MGIMYAALALGIVLGVSLMYGTLVGRPAAVKLSTLLLLLLLFLWWLGAASLTLGLKIGSDGCVVVLRPNGRHEARGTMMPCVLAPVAAWVSMGVWTAADVLDWRTRLSLGWRRALLIAGSSRQSSFT